MHTEQSATIYHRTATELLQPNTTSSHETVSHYKKPQGLECEVLDGGLCGQCEKTVTFFNNCTVAGRPQAEQLGLPNWWTTADLHVLVAKCPEHSRQQCCPTPQLLAQSYKLCTHTHAHTGTHTHIHNNTCTRARARTHTHTTIAPLWHAG